MLLMSVPIVSNNWRSHVTSHFDHHELTNVLVVLMVQSVSYDANTGITGQKVILAKWYHWQSISVMWCSHRCQQHHITKCYVTSCFNCLHTMKKILPLMMQWPSHGSIVRTNNITWLINLFITRFWSLWPNEWSDAICNTIGIKEMHVDIA